MDELEISGKLFISTRRAAKDHKYHSDYIGQLIRAGKVEGKKVGRSWYVAAGSLAEYLGKEVSPRGPKVIEVERMVATSAAIKNEKEEVEEKKEESTQEREKIEIETKEIESKIENEEEKISIYNEERRVPLKTPQPLQPAEAPQMVTQVMPGLRYISDSEPLFPAIKRNKIAITTMSKPVEEIIEEPTEEVIIRPQVERKKPRSTASFIRRTAALVVLGGLAVVVGAALSTYVVATTSIEKGQPASVHYGLSNYSASF
jgi:hypothetical protein